MLYRGKLLKFQRREIERYQQPSDHRAASLGLKWIAAIVAAGAGVWIWRLYQ